MPVSAVRARAFAHQTRLSECFFSTDFCGGGTAAMAATGSLVFGAELFAGFAVLPDLTGASLAAVFMSSGVNCGWAVDGRGAAAANWASTTDFPAGAIGWAPVPVWTRIATGGAGFWP